MLTEVTVGRGGWVHFMETETREGPWRWVALRFRQDGDRLEPAELYTPHIDALEHVSIPKLTGVVNGPAYRPEVLGSLEHRRVTVGDMLAEWPRLNRRHRRHRRMHLDAQVGREPNLVIDGITDDPGRRPDEFYEDVAHAYTAALMHGKHNPAAAIADANKVRVDRVRGWVREARRRGKLPPAGKAGRAG